MDEFASGWTLEIPWGALRAWPGKTSPLTLPPGATRTNSNQAMPVIKSNVAAIDARKYGAADTGCGPAAAFWISRREGECLVSVLRPFTHSPTAIDLPARCQDSPLAKVFHCRRLKPCGRAGTTPKS